MQEEYEQMELDTRDLLDAALETVAKSSIQTALEMILESQRQIAQRSQAAPPFVRNRYEAYGIAAEQLVKINAAVKRIKNDIDNLLSTLSDPNHNALEATSSIVNSASAAAKILISAAAEMRRTLDNLYRTETAIGDAPTPMEELVNSPEFQEAEPANAEPIKENETEDN